MLERTTAQIPATDRQVTAQDNQPASVAIATAQETTAELGAFLKETPAILNFEDLRIGNAWIERAEIAINGVEDERKPKAEPLYTQWKAINEPYRRVREPLEKLLTEIKRRVSLFNNKVEAERRAEAERLRREAEEKEHAAREAERRELDTIACADVGECTDVGTAIAEADAAFRDFQIANRTAQRAEREITVRTPSIVGGRSRSMRTVAIITVIDAIAAVKALGATVNITDAIRRDALAHEKEFGELPPGVTRSFERRM